LATGLIAMSKNDIIRYSNQNNIASMLVIKDGNNMKKYYSSSFKKFLKD
jgi:thiamine biosynthesis lipoprotein ApbE